VVVVREQTGQALALTAAGPDRLLDRVDDELAGHRGRH